MQYSKMTQTAHTLASRMKLSTVEVL